jgi:TorA maturation chaperone TorD
MSGRRGFSRYSIEINTARAVIYRFLSQCFSHPDKDLPGLFDSARIEEFLQSWRYLGLDAEEAVARITNWLTRYPDYGTALLELGKEYTRLFITAYPKVVAPPYSSVYLDKERLVWGKSTAEAARLYEAAGLGISENFHDIPDHIAAEFEFASYLISEQLRDRDNSTRITALDQIQKDFLSGHLLRWSPEFLSRVAEFSQIPFYQVVADLAREFLVLETQHLEKVHH